MDFMMSTLVNRMAVAMLGRGAAGALIAQHGRVELSKVRRFHRRIRGLKKEFRRRSALLDDLHRACRRSGVEVVAPLALISQIQRSGGSLLSQLFDGHPQLCAHPYELKIGFPKKHIWPAVDLADAAERWFEMLFEDEVLLHFKEGYKKGRQEGLTYAFILPPALQRRLFLDCITARPPQSARHVLNAYFTSYFGAWLNRAGGSGEKKFITAFTPRLAQRPKSIESFFADYPDGRLISILRAPENWYPSARGHNPKYTDLGASLAQWRENARSMIRNQTLFGDRVCLLRFEDLVGKTEAVMHHLAGFLGIDFHPLLLEPTFNGHPIPANTSFTHEKAPIMSGTLRRHTTLSNEELNIIAEMTRKDYRNVCEAAVEF